MINTIKKRIVFVIALMLIMSSLLCACDTNATDTSVESAEETTEVSQAPSETSATAETTLTAATTTSETTETSETEETTVETETSETEEEQTEETSEEPLRDIGYGSYGFLIGDMRFHSQNDISMMIEAEDATVYDFNARPKCSWLDTFYISEAFDMKTFDSSYRFLGYFNNETSVSFDGSVVIGTWTTPKSSNLDLYIAEITIISRNLVIKILPKYPEKPDYYNVSINGRGYYASVDQLQMADFFLSYLAENPGKDPLEGIIESEDHTYYF